MAKLSTDKLWLDRRLAEIERAGMTQRSVSLKAGLGAGYVNSLVKEGKDPAVDHVLRICAALDVSAAYILFGFNVTPETERIMRAVEDSPERRAALVALLGLSRES